MTTADELFVRKLGDGHALCACLGGGRFYPCTAIIFEPLCTKADPQGASNYLRAVAYAQLVELADTGDFQSSGSIRYRAGSIPALGTIFCFWMPAMKNSVAIPVTDTKVKELSTLSSIVHKPHVCKHNAGP